MQCPICRYQNPEGAKFCVECGLKLEKVCPECGSNNSPNFKFCRECGHKFTDASESTPKELSFDEKLDKIQRYLPEGITEKILSQKGKIEGERKQVTVMFCDMEGFTSLVENIGAEDAYDIMDQVYELLIHKVHDYGGTVNEMTGDGILALFGAPIALEDAPQRAIRSAYAIHREITKFGDKLKKKEKGILSLKMRIGIHSGSVIVGTLGNNLRVEFKAVGDTVNLASRVEKIAEAGTTYVSHDTFKLTEGLFRFEAIGQKQFKGKETPVGIYRVIAPSTRKTRFDVNAEHGLTPFTGRNRELELLLDSLGRAKEGSGQAFSIIGESGIGKSRLLYEFRKVIANEDITFLEGKCLSYGKGTPYHPICDILKGNFEIDDNETDEGIRTKVRKNLETMNADKASTLPYLLELLAVKETGIDSSLISPEEMKERTIESIKQIILKGAQIRPLVLAIEDLHWADKPTEDSLQWLFEAIPGARVLIILTYRPEFVHTWGGRSYHNQITLNRLSNRESLFMVSNLLANQRIDNELQGLILSKTEGIPFFIEEFVRSLIDLKLIKTEGGKILFKEAPQSISIPSTIHDVIMARVDVLPDAAKKLLQVASAIEREFSHDLIKLLADLPEKTLLSNMAILKDSELLYERGIYPESAYIFKHALTREVVYDSILDKRKQKIHNEIGTAIEAMQKGELESFGILAEHFILGENYEKGAEYFNLAGRQAMKKSSYSDAIEYAKKGIHCMEMLPQTVTNQKKIIDTRTSLSNYCMAVNYHDEAMNAVAPIIELTKKIKYRKRLSRIYVATGSYYSFVEEETSKAIEDLGKAIKLSEETGDFLSLWYAYYFIGSAYWLECDFDRSETFFQVCHDLSKAADNTTGICFSMGQNAAFNYISNGKIESAYNMSNETLKIAKQSGDIFIKQMAYSCFGTCSFMMGFFNEAESMLLEAIKMYGKTKQVAWGPWAYQSLGELYEAESRFDESKDCYRNAILALEHRNFFPCWIKFFYLKEVQAKVMIKITNVQPESLVEYARENKMKIFEGMISNSICNILMDLGTQHYSEAEKWINKAIKADGRIGNYWRLARDFAVYAELLKRNGDPVNAREKLGKAIEIFKECGADGWADRYETELTKWR